MKTQAPEFTKLNDLAAEKLGGKVLYSTDDFFAEKENLIRPGRGIFIPDKYTDRGKWMDGWESRRKRTEGHDWAIVQLAVPGIIEGVDIDTNHFLGNQPEYASIDACYLETEPTQEQLENDELPWEEILPKTLTKPGSQHLLPIASDKKWTHLKLHIYPDGGVARLKVYGKVVKDWSAVSDTEVLDLAGAINGGQPISCNDMFFSHMGNLIMPDRGVNMGDGWETKRNRTPNNKDWVILKLATKGVIKNIVVDTNHFKGNYPDRCSLEGCVANDDNLDATNIEWFEILPEVKLQANKEHFFDGEVTVEQPCTHVRFFIYPDGGVSRLRLFGIKAS